MKHLLILAVLLVASSYLQAETITILSMSDTHSCLSPAGPRDTITLEGKNGGVAKAATVIAMNKMEDPNTILLHAGDISIGDLFFNKYLAVPELNFLQSLACDALTLGNHEFDLTPDALLLSLNNAFQNGSFPILSTNFETFDNPDLSSLKSFISPYTIINRGQRKIGVFGLTTPEANVLSQPYPAFIDTAIVERAISAVTALKAESCDLIIMNSHLGQKLDEIIAYYVDGIDLVICGHDHKPTEELNYFISASGNRIPYLQTDPFYQSIGKITVDFQGSNKTFTYEKIMLDENIPQEASVKAAVDQLIADLELSYGKLFTSEVCTIQNDMNAECDPKFQGTEELDTPIGNLICDAFKAWGQTDIAIQPGGCIAQDLKAGPITGEDIFRTMGYGFNEYNTLGYRMATFNLKGEYLLVGLENGLANLEENDEYLIQASGLEYTANMNKPAGERLKKVTVNGNKFDPDKIYSITSNEFVVMFLDYMGLPYSDLVINPQLTEFEVVLGYVSTYGIAQKIEGRITPVEDELELSNAILFPNPCSSDPILSFNIPEDGEYSLYLINPTGSVVKDISSKYYRKGKYKKIIQLDDLSSGIYYLLMKHNNFVQKYCLVYYK